MLENYFVRPTTVDRIRASWIGEAIEQYVVWLDKHGYAARNVPQRVPLLLRFGEFARQQGATTCDALPKHIEPFVQEWLNAHDQPFPDDESRCQSIRSVRGPICQFLRVVVSDYQGGGRGHDLPRPFLECVPQFFDYLVSERGLSAASLAQYDHHLRCFEAYLADIELVTVAGPSPAVLSGYITQCVFRSSRPPIPVEAGLPFRSMPGRCNAVMGLS